MDIKNIFQQIDLENSIQLDEMPEIDLYMDQVIQLFEAKLSSLKRNDEEKILTKTMINNYAKGKLLFPIKNKKYSKEHLILMSLIYNLKGALSINDIKLSLDRIIKTYEENNKYPIRELYNCFLEESKEDIKEFNHNINEKLVKIEGRVKDDDKLTEDFDQKFLLLCSMINMSNMYRRLSEKLIDEFFVE